MRPAPAAPLARPGGRFPKVSPLALGIGISVGVHALLLSLHFALPDLSRSLREQALDIILVNSRSARKPVDAQAIAQANLDGGGTTEENRRAKTPLPATAKQADGAEVEQIKRRVAELEAAQQQLLTRAKSLHSTTASPTPAPQGEVQPTVTGQDLLETARAMARLEGEISKSIDEYNKRPRKLFPGVRALRSERAAYEDSWRQKVERIGTLNYPPEARGKVYGALVLSVTVDREGYVVEVTIERSSGQKILDDAAKRIVRMGSPYGPLPAAIGQQYDNLVIIRTWSFTQGNALETK